MRKLIFASRSFSGREPGRSHVGLLEFVTTFWAKPIGPEFVTTFSIQPMLSQRAESPGFASYRQLSIFPVQARITRRQSSSVITRSSNCHVGGRVFLVSYIPPRNSCSSAISGGHFCDLPCSARTRPQLAGSPPRPARAARRSRMNRGRSGVHFPDPMRGARRYA